MAREARRKILLPLECFLLPLEGEQPTIQGEQTFFVANFFVETHQLLSKQNYFDILYCLLSNKKINNKKIILDRRSFMLYLFSIEEVGGGIGKLFLKNILATNLEGSGSGSHSTMRIRIWAQKKEGQNKKTNVTF